MSKAKPTMKEEKTIYNLKLHEGILIEAEANGYSVFWKVTRVAGGWLYQESLPKSKTANVVFVPFILNFE